MEDKNRKLTPAEIKRAEAFEALSAELEGKGYRRTDLLVNILRANMFAVALFLGYAALTFFIFVQFNELNIKQDIIRAVLTFVALLALIVVHELIHGATWSLFTENGWKDIEFGVQLDTLTPYCTCRVPLKKGQYILGGLMPMLLLGIVPTVISFFTGSYSLLFIGALMFSSAAGDILIVWKLLTYNSEHKDQIIIDHPTEAGCVIFER